MEIKLIKDPYYEGEKIFHKNSFVLEPNTVTCLVGCNGSGKSTIVDQIICSTKAEQIETDTVYVDLRGALRSIAGRGEGEKPKYYYFLFNKKTETASKFEDHIFNKIGESSVSTGEHIVNRYSNSLPILGSWIRSHNNEKLFVIFDDCDAGTSIDMIDEIKDVFQLIINDCVKYDIEYYIILTANSFELAKDFDCLSVIDFKHRHFKTYQSFKTFVLKTREAVNKREEEFRELRKQCKEEGR